MPNQTIVDYLNQNKDKFSMGDLKKALVGQGYQEKEVDEAINIVSGKVAPPPPPATPVAMPSSIKKENIQKGAVNFLSSIFKGVGIPEKQYGFYTEAMKLGAIGSVVSRLITALTSFLAWGVLFSLFIGVFGSFAGYYGYRSYGFDVVSLITGLFWSVVTGAIGIVVFLKFIIKYWPKFLGKTLFAKLFYLNLIITVLFGGLLGILASIFFPPVLFSFLVIIIGSIVASYANAKIIAGGLEKKYPEILKEVAGV